MTEEGDFIQTCEDLDECAVDFHNCDSGSLDAQLGMYFPTTRCVNQVPHINNDDYKCDCEAGFENVQTGNVPGRV